MVKIIFSLSCACLLVLLGHIDCAAFRCGDGFVGEGASKTKVQLECGKPTSMEKAGVKKEPGEQTTKGKAGERKAKRQKKDKQLSKDSRPAVRGEYDEVSKKRIEKWYYNCGDNDFIYVLTFEGGVLKKEETGGYGKGKSDCQGKKR